MTPLSPPDLDRLEALARAATPGKRSLWPPAAHDTPERCQGIVVGPIPEDPLGEPGELAWFDATQLVVTDCGVYPPKMPDALFIAACDVETVLALISEIHGWRTAAGIERTAGVARCIIVAPEVP